MIKQYTKQAPPSSLVSNLSRLFITTISYYTLSKQDALDTIGYFLYDHNDLIHGQVLDCFISHKLLLYKLAENNFSINYDACMNGIFIPLTKCYSPSCQLNNQTCYSPLCPNKRISSLLRLVNLNQQTQEQDVLREQDAQPKDWITSIPNHIRNSTNRKELKRQAGIAELLLTEQNYCQDLDILHRIYAIPLLESTLVISNPSRRKRFYQNVFGNYLDITHIHLSFYRQLTSHRQSSFFIGRVGNIIMQHVTNLIDPYILYASNHVKAIFCMSLETNHNLMFSKFLADQNSLKCTRRLGLRHYLTSPTLWIGKLKLLVQAILKNTVDDADQLSLKASLAILHDTLCRMNTCANVSPEGFRFEELSTSIYTISGSELELLAIPEGSNLIREEALWLARSTHPLQPSLCHVFLFSHALILTHPRVTNGRTEYIVVSGSPIPIQLLSLNQANSTTSMIRRLSFASTSIVSTPFHLISNLRRQKSVNSDISLGSTQSSPTQRTTTLLRIKPKVTIQFKSSKLLKKLKANFKWNLFDHQETKRCELRRDSAPAALLIQYNKPEKKLAQHRRTLKICHMAYPENAFKLEFLSRSDRLIWENVMREVVMSEGYKVFRATVLCNSLAMPQMPVHGGTIGRIRCAYAFLYSSGIHHKSMVALGSQSGVWMGPRDGSRPFQLVLPNQDVYQVSVLQDKLIVLTQDNKHRLLIAYNLKSILGDKQDLDWRLQKTWLVIIVPSLTHMKNHWFKKYRMEHIVSIKDPNDIQIINDSVFIRSDRHGVERIDISTKVMDLFVETRKIFTGSNVGVLSMGFVCDPQYAYAVPLFEQADKGLVRMKFESVVNNVAMIYPYLVAFSSSVIEVRHIETTELIQAVQGHQIQFISINNDFTQPLFFTMQNEDRITTSIYQLQLSL
ncbi:hypothetical protein HPULCUR_006332 [Helicostylum pulchrum]|uniref:DH domain-containing protein n=1 Tax=Helicostylum pulchrum TaxID=562976 RepID=A0ABP9Y1L4_9FUNG